MSEGTGDFDPEAPEKSAVGSEVTDGDPGIGSVLTHLYRGEMDRTVEWRSRTDRTTNWAVTIMSAIVAYSFSGQVSHAVILAGVMVGMVFAFIEARRYQEYDVWRSRVRSMQENFFATAIDPSQGVEETNWRAELSADYRDPRPKIGYREALAHRLRRVYLPLISAMLLAWLFHLWALTSGESFVESAGLPGVPGWAVLGTVGAFYAVLFVLAVPRSSKGRGEAGGADHGDLE